MKIISPFKDYYDYLQAYGQEPGIVYNRKPATVWAHKVETLCPVKWQDVGARASLLGFCGEIIPRISYWRDEKSWEREVLWGSDAAEYAKKITAPELHNWKRFVLNPVSLDWLFKAVNAPVFIIDSGGETTNPCLQELKFDEYMDAQSVYQSISSFIGNQKEQMQIPARSDKEKVVSHGFDKKTSFRPKIKQ